MMKLIRETHIDFLAVRKLAFALSLAVILAGAVSMIARGGLRYSIDFEGGRLIDIAFTNQDVSASTVRSVLDELGLGEVEVQNYQAGAQGSHPGVLLRMKLGEAGGGDESPAEPIIAKLEERVPGLQAELRQEDSVGPKVGDELRGKAVQALLYALGGILIYVGVRYEFIWSFGAVSALFHDVIVTVAFFSILNKEISLSIVAALLTIAGFSINDTIVIFDRIRERRKMDSRRSLYDLINESLNQTLSRTIITSFTVLLTTLALFFFGGPVLHDFAFAMIVGIFAGTYSTIYVASALAYEIHDRRGARRRKKAAAAVASA